MNTLIVAASLYAGYGPYVSEIVNNFKNEKNIYFLFRDDETNFCSKNIIPEIKDRSIFVFTKVCNKSLFDKLLSLFCLNRKFIKIINSICQEKNIDNIHFLTDGDYSFYRQIISWQNKYKVFYTVHDLHPHETKKIFYKAIRAKINYQRREKIYSEVCNLVTNSKEQYEELVNLFPGKKIYYHEFPTLVNKCVEKGEASPIELNNVKNYILFFGRVEKYKGIDLLYNTYINSEKLQQKYPLVIAGSGNIYFKRDLNKEKNIIFLNRYIDDNEVKSLYKNAYCVVYPYISATQSGVLSLSSYFEIPTIVSDIPYFFNIMSKYDMGLLFKKNNSESLQNALLSLEKMNLKAIKHNQKLFYNEKYDPLVLKGQLLKIYKS
jgi:glycosyltransferase involved in cell wall biosynthesis